MANITKKELEATYAAEQSFIKRNIELLKEEQASLGANFDIKKKMALNAEIIKNNQKLINEMEAAGRTANKDGLKIHGNTLNAINKEIKGIESINKEITKENKGIQDTIDKSEKRIQLLRRITDLYIGQNLLGIGFVKTLNEQDKIIRQTILSLGMSGAKAESMRLSFEGSAMNVAQIGGTLQDIADIQTGFANETGRARALTQQMVYDIAEIGKGTTLGVEGAARMAAQFEIMGNDARASNQFAQNIVDTSERMGVNTSNVFKKINDQFKKLNTYSFVGGIKGMGQMAMYAEKMKVDMAQALNAADVAKSLEGAIDLAANLQIMGGEFAKTDPFEMLFLSRNDPAKFTEKISDMTRGLVTFRKNADGTFEKFISPADRDRLAAVSKSLGMDVGTLTEMAQRTADIQKMRREMSGAGLSSKEKELIEGAAIFNSKTGKFEVEIGQRLKQLSELTKSDALALATQTSSLQERAKNAMDFETAFKATVESFKSILLPMLRGFNTVMEFVRPFFEGVANFLNKMPKGLLIFSGIVAGALMTASLAIRGFTQSIIGAGVMNKFNGRGFFGTGANGYNALTQTGGNVGNAGRASRVGRGVRGARAAAGATGGITGSGMLAGGAGIGLAAVGIGAGIGLAAVGISKLADSLNKLDENKAQLLKEITLYLGGFVTIGAIAGAALVAFALSTDIAASGLALAAPAIAAFGSALLIVGGAILMIGAGIAAPIAALGYLINSFGNLGTGISSAMSSISKFKIDPFTIVSLAAIASTSGDFVKIGNAFEQIGTVLTGKREDFEAIERSIKSIASTSVNSDSVFGQLSSLLSKPLKVEFADKSVQIATNITLEIDGEKFMNKTLKQNGLLQIIHGK